MDRKNLTFDGELCQILANLNIFALFIQELIVYILIIAVKYVYTSTVYGKKIENGLNNSKKIHR